MDRTGDPIRGGPPSPAPLGLALAALALASRWWSWQQTAVVFNDGPRYLRQAQAILDGQWAVALTEPYHPLYAVLASGVASLGVGLEDAAAWVSITAGSAAIVVLFALLRDAFGSPYDWLGALLAAIHPRAVEFSSDIQSEGVYLAFFLLAVWLGWRALERGSPRDAAATGVAAALAFWTRPEGIGVAMGAAVLAPWWAWRAEWGLARTTRWLAALGVAVLVGVGAYTVALHVATGEWRATQKKVVLAPATLPASAAPSGATKEAMPVREPPALRTLRPRTGATLAAAIDDLWTTARSTARPVVLVGFAIALIALRGRCGRRGLWLLGLAAAYCVLLMWLLLTAGYVSRRHILPPLLPLFGYAALGLATLWAYTGGRAQRLRRLASPAPLLIVAMLAVPFQIQPRRIDKLAERNAAEWLAAQPPGAASDAVAGIGGRIGYYARRPMIDFRGFGAAELPDAFITHGVDFAISDRAEWIAVLKRDPRFEIVHEAEAAGHRAFVFARTGADE